MDETKPRNLIRANFFTPKNKRRDEHQFSQCHDSSRIEAYAGDNSPGYTFNQSIGSDPEAEVSSNGEDTFDDSLNDRLSETQKSLKSLKMRESLEEVKGGMSKNYNQKQQIPTQTEPVTLQEKQLQSVEDLIELLMASQGRLCIESQSYSLDVGLLREARMDLRKNNLLNRQQYQQQLISQNNSGQTNYAINNNAPNNLHIEIRNLSIGTNDEDKSAPNVNFESNRENKKSQEIAPTMIHIEHEQPEDQQLQQNRLSLTPSDQNIGVAGIGSTKATKKKKKKVSIHIAEQNDSKYENQSPLQQQHPQEEQKQPEVPRKKKKKKIQLNIQIDETGIDSFDPIVPDVSPAELIQKAQSTPAPIVNALQKIESQSASTQDELLNSLQSELGIYRKTINNNTTNKSSSKNIDSVIQAKMMKLGNKLSDYQDMGFSNIEFLNNPLMDKSRSQSYVQISKAQHHRQKYQQNDALIKRKKNQLDIGYLFASPLVFGDKEVIQDKKMGLQEISAIRFQDEIEAIKQAINESKQAITFQSQVATHANFVEVINKQPRILHIACHGLHNDWDTSVQYGMTLGTKDSQTEADNNNFLLFENKIAEGILISANQLLKLVRSTMTSLDLVFVAACDSEIVGKIFQRCQAKHVICVKQQRFVLDQAAVAFTKIFYTNILQEMTICESFEKAKAAVEFQFKRNEADLFTILLAEHTGLPNQIKLHDCHYLQSNGQGKLNCQSDHIYSKNVQKRSIQIKYHTKTLWRLINSIQKGNRMNQLLGLHGLGKTTLAKAAMQYLMERKYFSGGIFFFPSKSIRNCHRMQTNIWLKIQENYGLKQQSWNENQQSAASSKQLSHYYDNELEGYLISFFKQQSNTFKLKPMAKKIQMQDLKFIICFDSVEDLIEHDGENFREFLSKLLNQCDSLSIILTSTRPIGIMPKLYSTTPEIVFLQNLKPRQAVELFIDLSGEIYEEEILDLILANPKDCLSKLLSDPKEIAKTQGIGSLSTVVRDKIMIALKSYRKRLDALASHDIFKQLAGNPLSIKILAGFHKTEHIQNNNLADIYRRFVGGKKDSEIQKGQDEDGIDKFMCNRVSLSLSTEATITLLKETSKKSYDLFFFLGCFPVGISKQCLQNLKQSDLEQDLHLLETMNLLECNDQKKIALWPFLFQYVNESVAPEDRDQDVMQLCEHFGELIHHVFDIYFEVSTLSQEIKDQKNQTNAINQKNDLLVPKAQFDNLKERPSLKGMIRLFQDSHQQIQSFSEEDYDTNNQHSTYLYDRKYLLKVCINELTNFQYLLDVLTKKAQETFDFQRQKTSAVRTNEQEFQELKRTLTIKKDQESHKMSTFNKNNYKKRRQTMDQIHITNSVGQLESQDGSSTFDQDSLNLSSSSNNFEDYDVIKDQEGRLDTQPQDVVVSTKKSNQKDAPTSGSTNQDLQQKKMVSANEKRQRYIKKHLNTHDLQPVAEEIDDDSDMSSRMSSDSSVEDSCRKNEIQFSLQPSSSNEEYKTSQEFNVPTAEALLQLNPKKQSKVLQRRVSMQSLRLQQYVVPLVEESKSKVDARKKFTKNDSYASFEEFLGDIGTMVDRYTNDLSRVKNLNFNNKYMNKYLKSNVQLCWGDVYSDSESSDSDQEETQDQQQLKQDSKTAEYDKNSYPMQQENKINTNNNVDTSAFKVSQHIFKSDEKQNRSSLAMQIKGYDEETKSLIPPRIQKDLEQQKQHDSDVAVSVLQLDEVKDKIGKNKAFQSANINSDDVSQNTKNTKKRQFKKASTENVEDMGFGQIVPTKRQSTIIYSNQFDQFDHAKQKKDAQCGLLERNAKTPVTTQQHRRVYDNYPQVNLYEKIKTQAEEETKLNQTYKIDPAGRFILFMAAMSFISNDHEYALMLCSQNFSSISNTFVFEGNILRLKALCLQHIYSHKKHLMDYNFYSLQKHNSAPKDHPLHPLKKQQTQRNLTELELDEQLSEGNSDSNCGNNNSSSHRQVQFLGDKQLIEAIQAVENALELYSHELYLNNQNNPNTYGQALSHFQLGQLYHVFAEDLVSNTKVDSARGAKGSIRTESKEMSLEKAFSHFEKAMELFKEVNHLRGMQLSTKHLIKCLRKDTYRNALRRKLQKQESDYEQLYNEYVTNHGLHKSCHRERIQGEDVSLMVEIVMFNQSVDLFPTQEKEQKILNTLMALESHQKAFMNKKINTVESGAAYGTD